ncbi:MAG: CPXCG motif-containing cysteine-rich protein [Planctomycetota bacterium]|nr:CPXCG motif-containing cysteine-rich protein [Planctomycetota bacterium]
MENVQGEYSCPSCGERIIVPVDPSAGSSQSYVEDCPVCCSPNELSVVLEGESARVDARAE